MGLMRRLMVWLAVAGLTASAAATTLKRGNQAEPDTLDPPKYGLIVELNILNDLFDGLVVTDSAGEPVPGTAESWEMSADGVVYTFRLRENLTWSDGAPLTAGDFAAGFRRALDPGTAAQLADLAYTVKNARAIAAGEMPPDQLGVRAIDDRTFEVTLEAPDLTFIRLVAGYALFFPLPRHVYATAGEAWAKPGTMVSNGPYVLAEWTPADKVRVVKNPNYWDAANVAIDEVIFYPTTDEVAALNQFRAGELDLSLGFPPGQYEWLKKNMQAEVSVTPASAISFLTLNLRNPKFADARVRRAISLAIDRTILTDRVLATGQTPAYGVIPKVVKGYTPAPESDFSATPMPERITEARDLLQAAGYGPDRPLTFRLDYRAGDANKKVIVAIASMLQRIGIIANLQANEVKVHYAKLRAGDFEAADGGWQGTPDPVFFALLLQTGSDSNYGGWSNAEFDRLTRAAAIEIDPAKRMTMYAEADRIAMADTALVPLYNTAHRVLVQQWAKGFEGNAINTHRSSNLKIER